MIAGEHRHRWTKPCPLHGAHCETCGEPYLRGDGDPETAALLLGKRRPRHGRGVVCIDPRSQAAEAARDLRRVAAQDAPGACRRCGRPLLGPDALAAQADHLRAAVEGAARSGESGRARSPRRSRRS
jgi:hypothetical protein